MPHIYSRTFLSSGDYPQLLGFLLFPVCLWAFTSLFKQMRIRYWLAAVISLTVLVFSHQQQAMIGAGALLLYCLLLAAGYRRFDGLVRCAIAALLAALLSAGYWLPALGDLPLIRMDSALQDEGYFGNNFLTWETLFSIQPFIWDYRAGNPLSLPYNTFGFAQWLAAAVGFASVLIWPRDKKKLAWCIAGILLTLGILTLTLPTSASLWNTVPGLAFLQYPFRLLPVAVLGVLPASAAAVDVWPIRLRWLASFVLILAALILPFPYLYPALATQITIVSTKSLSAGETQKRGVGVESLMPKDADLDIVLGYRSEPKATTLTWRTPHEAVADLSEQSEPMLLRLHFHPGWSAGNRAELTSGPSGFVQVTDLRNPDRPLEIRWEGTVWQRRGERLSLLGLFACSAGLLYLVWRRKMSLQTQTRATQEEHDRNLQTTHGQEGRWALVGLVFSLVVLRYAISWSNTFPFLLTDDRSFSSNFPDEAE